VPIDIDHQIPPTARRPWGLPLPVRLLPVLTHLRTNLTTRALAQCSAPTNPPWTRSSITWCRIRARVEHVIARLKDWQILWQCRRRGQAINHSPHTVAGLCNLKTRGRLRVNS
jgi:hypothetical protein